MMKVYKDYTIDIIVTHKERRRYTAKVWIGPILYIPRTLRDMGELEDYTTREEANQAGFLWGKEQINAYIENRRPAL